MQNTMVGGMAAGEINKKKKFKGKQMKKGKEKRRKIALKKQGNRP